MSADTATVSIIVIVMFVAFMGALFWAWSRAH